MHPYALTTIATATLALLLACGDSDDKMPTASGSGGSGGTMAAGTGGSSANNNTGGTSSTMDAGTTTGGGLTCGAMTCVAPDLIGQAGLDAGAAGTALGIDPSTLGNIGVTSCCTPDTNVCGVQNSTLFSGCREQDMPGVPDDACPSIDVVYSTTVPFALTLNGALPACCNTRVGVCGVDLSAVILDLGIVGNLIGVTEPLDVNIGLGCLPLTQADSIRGQSIEIVTDAGTSEPMPCGNLDDAGN